MIPTETGGHGAGQAQADVATQATTPVRASGRPVMGANGDRVGGAAAAWDAGTPSTHGDAAGGHDAGQAQADAATQATTPVRASGRPVMGASGDRVGGAAAAWDAGTPSTHGDAAGGHDAGQAQADAATQATTPVRASGRPVMGASGDRVGGAAAARGAGTPSTHGDAAGGHDAGQAQVYMATQATTPVRASGRPGTRENDDLARELNEPVRCKCQVAMCELCGICSRCGCGHDGTTPQRAVKRKRGERGKAKRGRRENPKRAKNTYRQGDLFESPLEASKSISATDDFILFSAFPSSNPAVAVSSSEGFNTIRGVLRAFGMGSKVSATIAHIPSLERRQNVSTWQLDDDQGVKAAQRVIVELVTRLCTVFCGNNEETGAHLSGLLLRNPSERTGDDLEAGISNVIADCYSQAEKGSTEKRVLRACLTHIPRARLSKQYSRRPNFTLSCDSYAAGRADLVTLLSGGKLVSGKRSVCRYDDAEVSKAVKLILSPANINFLSWGTKRVKVGSEWVLLPAMNRRRSKTRVYESYVQQSIATLPNKMLSRASFFRIVSAITAGGSQTRKAVDYVVGFLVNDTFELLQRLIPAISTSYDEGERLLADMEVTRSYLKYGFDSRVREGKACLLHSIEYGLKRQSGVSTAPVCENCANLFAFFRRVEQTAIASSADRSTLTAIADCREKATLYLGHRIRVLNQQRAISQLTDDMKARSLQTRMAEEAVVLIDFKMKLEPIYYREKTVDHYGKKGMSWHGASIQYWEYQEGENAGDEPELVDQKLYYDHISSGDTKQDRECVISVVEAVLIRLKKDLPHVKRIVLQSDNAPCYQNMLLPLVLPFLSINYGIEIVRFIHTETQDGKSILDAHFARAMQALMDWVREGNNCITPTQAAIGLGAHGGLKNSVVELIEHDRDCLNKFVDQVTAMEGQLKKLFSRANDIQISFVGEQRFGREHIATYKQCPQFQLQVFEYSGIGEGVHVLCSPAEGTIDNVGISAVPSVDDQRVTDGDDEEDGEVDADDFDGEEDGDCSDDEDDSDSESEVEEEASDLIQVGVEEGTVTGVSVATQGQLRRRVRRWKQRPVMETTKRESKELVDIVSSAVSKVMTMHGAKELYVQAPSGLYHLSTVGSINGTTATLPAFLSGWAIRPRRGSMYGRRYIREFRGIIRELFEQGRADKALKLGPGRMREELQKRFPGRFDLPSENEIRQEISKLHKMTSTGGHASSPTTSKATSRKKEYEDFFETLLAEDVRIKPKVAIQKFEESFCDSGLTVAQIRYRFAATRTAMNARSGQ